MWGNQTYSEWFAFEMERTWSLITSNFTYLCSEVPGEALFLSQGLYFFQTWRNYTFVAQSPSPGKSFECPLTPGVPHSHGVAVVWQTAFIPCFPPNLCVQTPVPGSLSFVFCVSKREPGSGQCVLSGTEWPQLSCLGHCQGSPPAPLFQGIPVTAVAVLLQA